MIYKYLKNVTEKSADFYVYGDIVSERGTDFWTGEKSATQVDPTQLREELKESGVEDLNIFINSPGGSVFAADAMVSMLKRAEDSGLSVHGYIDGLCASAATYLAMAANDITIYSNSLMMIHKPMTVSMGNADDLQKDIDTLNTIENNMMIPMYMVKAVEGVTEDDMKRMISEETWFSGNSSDDMYIGNYFNVTLADEAKDVAACLDYHLFSNYKHVPGILLKAEEKPEEKPEKADFSTYWEEIRERTAK